MAGGFQDEAFQHDAFQMVVDVVGGAIASASASGGDPSQVLVIRWDLGGTEEA